MMLKFIGLLFLGIIVWPSDSVIIKSRMLTNYGDWYEMKHCPDNMYAVGMQIKFQNAQGGDDDTGLNGVVLYCEPLNASK